MSEIKQVDSVRSDALYDSAYCAGLQQGFSFGQMDDNDGFRKALEARQGYLAVLRSKPVENKYEPGPWEVNDQRASGWMNNSMYVGSANTGLIIARVYNDKGDEEANARLIAAAPELLELAKQYASECGGCAGTGLVTVHHRGMDCDDQPCQECADIRAVLAKATGSQS